MIYSTESLLKSVATVIKAKYSYPVYANPNQQGTDTPCFFIMLMPSEIKEEIGDYQMFEMNLDVIFLQERNTTGINLSIYKVMEYLTEKLNLFTYTDEEGESMPMHGHDFDISIDDEELHFKFHIKERVRLPRTPNHMKTLEAEDVTIKDKKD